jgi:capsular exopolysaccharide synthesis family protein
VRLEEKKLKAALAGLESAVMDINRKRITLEALDRDIVWAKELYEPLAARKNRLALASGNETPPVKVWDRALKAGGPVKPRKTMIILVAAMMGLMVGAQLALLIEGADTTVRGPADVEAAASLRVAGTIPHMNMQSVKDRVLVCQLSPKSPSAEAFRALRTSVVFDGSGDVRRSILVTSSVENEGKTLVSLNLAVAFAQMGKKVLIVDADLRRSGVHKVLGMPGGLGLSDVLTGQGEPELAVSKMDVPGLSIMTAGNPPENPAELLHSPAMKGMLDWATKTFDLVIIDSPPLTSVTDASLIARHVEGVILVSRSHKTRKGVVARSGRILVETKAHIIGAVLNDIPKNSRGDGYSCDSGYGYGYGYPEKSSTAKDG